LPGRAARGIAGFSFASVIFGLAFIAGLGMELAGKHFMDLKPVIVVENLAECLDHKKT
jgi:hypothetical protein